MATDLTESDFAAMIGVATEQLASLEREGLPTVGTGKAKRYPTPMAVRWYIDFVVTRRVGGIPPRANQQDFAALVGIVPRQVKNLVDNGKITTVIDGSRRLYPLPLAVHEFIKYQKDNAAGARKEELSELDAARLRKLNAEADKAEMEALRDRGEQMMRVDSERAIGEILQALRSQINQAPNRYSRKFVGLTTEAKSRQMLKSMFNGELVRWGAAVAGVGRRISIVAEDLTPDDEESSATSGEAVDG